MKHRGAKIKSSKINDFQVLLLAWNHPTALRHCPDEDRFGEISADVETEKA